MTTLGCARNDVDSEELAGRLAAGGWTVVEDSDGADAVLVNTCGFVEQAKKDSVDTLLAEAGEGRPVIAVGCMAERYGRELAESLPEAAAVLGFDDYEDIAATLRSIVDGDDHIAHIPRDRRTLLPISPVDRPRAAVGIPGHAGGPRVPRARLGSGPSAPVKLASGCDRRCAFCAIPTFRGAFVSRRPGEVLGDVQWLAEHGVREVVLVSENSTSYGKDLGEPDLLQSLLPDLAAVVERIRVNYLQPAEIRPGLIEAIATTANVVPYFDLSFQHSSATVLRRMRRFGSTEAFLDLITQARSLAPDAGFRTNVIVGFPGETEDDVAELEHFLTEGRLDAVGVFGYSDEDGTEAVGFADKIDPDEVLDRVSRVTALVEELGAQRAEARIGESLDVLIESVGNDADGQGRVLAEGRAAHQAPEDGATSLVADGSETPQLRVGQLVPARVTAAVGWDLEATVTGPPR